MSGEMAKGFTDNAGQIFAVPFPHPQPLHAGGGLFPRWQIALDAR